MTCGRAGRVLAIAAIALGCLAVSALPAPGQSPAPPSSSPAQGSAEDQPRAGATRAVPAGAITAGTTGDRTLAAAPRAHGRSDTSERVTRLALAGAALLLIALASFSLLVMLTRPEQTRRD